MEAVGASWASFSVCRLGDWLRDLSKNDIFVVNHQGHPGKEGPAGEKGAQVSLNVDLNTVTMVPAPSCTPSAWSSCSNVTQIHVADVKKLFKDITWTIWICFYCPGSIRSSGSYWLSWSTWGQGKDVGHQSDPACHHFSRAFCLWWILC